MPPGAGTQSRWYRCFGSDGFCLFCVFREVTKRNNRRLSSFAGNSAGYSLPVPECPYFHLNQVVVRKPAKLVPGYPEPHHALGEKKLVHGNRPRRDSVPLANLCIVVRIYFDRTVIVRADIAPMRVAI